MRLLIDSHALIWYVDQDHLVSRASLAAMTDPSNDLLLGAGTIWEIGIKVHKNATSKPLSVVRCTDLMVMANWSQR